MKIRIVDKEKFSNFIIVLISIILVITMTVLFINALKEHHEIDHTVTYTVAQGETLWTICTEYRPEDMSIQEYIYNVREYNKIDPVIYPNQEIELLIYKEV